jgi:DDE superfamily endonuclease
MWCVPNLTPLFIERMEHLLDLYAKPYDKKEPVICFDEKSKQLLKDTRGTRRMREGHARRQDYEYKREGTKNIFLTVEPKGGYRNVRVTERRTRADFAKEIKRIIGLPRYLEATKVHIVLDNLNTHFEKSLLLTFGPEETKSMMQRLVFHYSPCHASWLNMAEIEIGVMSRQCVKGRIATEYKLKEQLRAWQAERNRDKAMIDWKFGVKEARKIFKYRRGTGGKGSKLC